MNRLPPQNPQYPYWESESPIYPFTDNNDKELRSKKQTNIWLEKTEGKQNIKEHTWNKQGGGLPDSTARFLSTPVAQLA